MDQNIGQVKMFVAGEHGLVVEFGTVISPQINELVQKLTKLLQSKTLEGIIEVVPTYCCVTIYFDPLLLARHDLSQFVKGLINEMKHIDMECLLPKVVHIPVCYGGVLGPDLEFVARSTGLSAQDVVQIHTSKPYLVYMLGFTPGFAYLGGLPTQITLPRQEKLRANIPAGSVGVGGNQTGFYPMEGQGEWWLIGRTPIKAFDPKKCNPFLLSAGDYLHFEAISIEEYFAIRRQVTEGTYATKVSQG